MSVDLFLIGFFGLMAASMATILLHWLAARECARWLAVDLPEAWGDSLEPERWSWFHRVESLIRDGQADAIPRPELRRAIKQFRATRLVMIWVLAPATLSFLVWAFLAESAA